MDGCSRRPRGRERASARPVDGAGAERAPEDRHRRRVAVLGAGLVGGALVERLLERGHSVVLATRAGTARPGVEGVALDFAALPPEPALRRVFEGVEAFYLFFVSLTRDVHAIAVVARYVVIADWIFTATTIVFQPASGFYLAHRIGYPLTEPWLFWSIVLYVIATLCWLPVVWLQMRLRDIAVDADARGRPLPRNYKVYLGVWTALGVPALVSFLAIFYMMVARSVPFAG